MSSHPHPHGDLVNENVHHEESDINVRSIITFVVVLTVIALSINVSMVGLFKLLNKIEDKTEPVVSPLTAPAAQVSDFPSPSLQTTPWVDLRKLRASENEYLHSYGWVDQSAGIARIPIDKAKAMLLQKGLPVRADAVTDPTEGTHFAVTGESSGGRNLPAGKADASSTTAAVPSQGASPIVTPGTSGNPPTASPNGAPAGGTGAASTGQQTGQPAAKAAAKKPGGGGQ
jgi:hypothetical protein